MNSSEIDFLRKQGIVPIKTLAKGGYGTIYLVFHQQYKTNFALKKIPEQNFEESEIECLKTIYDPRIVSLYQYYQFQGHIYLLMEYCPDDLGAMLKNHTRFNREDMMMYAQGVLLCIKACHDRKIAHNDIKPSNFLLDSYGRVKIADFGLSQMYSDRPSSSEFKGTSLYMAPEIFDTAPYNPLAADIWAAGVILYYMATNCFPFYSKDTSVLITKIQMGNYLDGLVEDPQLRDLIARCITVNAYERATIEELLSHPYFDPINQSKRELLSLAGKTTIKKSRVMICKPNANGRKSMFCIHSMQHQKNSHTQQSIRVIDRPSKSSEFFAL